MEGAGSGFIELHPGILTPRRVPLPENFFFYLLSLVSRQCVYDIVLLLYVMKV